MTIVSDLTVDPSTWHPSWCSSDHCTAPDRLAERGLTEADVPLHLRHTHRSAPARTGDPLREEPAVDVQATRFVDQPPPAAGEPGVDAIELTVRHSIVGTRVVALLEPAQLDQLATVITDMRALVHGHLGGDR